MKTFLISAVACSLGGTVAGGASALDFNFRPEAGTGQTAIEGFRAAGNLWTARLIDPITIVIDIGFRPLDPGVLAQAGSQKLSVAFSNLQTALASDKTSADDNFFDTIPAELSILLNRTANSVHGSGSDLLFLDNDGDANNTTVLVNRANAKALGLLPAEDPAPDAAITFSSEFLWDFDPSDGIEQNSFSFIAVAAHEIGHSLGFVSGVDMLDSNSAPGGPFFPDELFVFVAPADLVRISAESTAEGMGVVDWAADTRIKYFAPGAATNEAGGFSTGRRWGDGRQASHWKDNLGLGLMDPTAARGEHAPITTLDLKMFDLIGYDLAKDFLAAEPQPPEPVVIAQADPVPAESVETQVVPSGDVQRVQAAPGAPVVAFSADAEVPILELSYDGGMIEDPDPTPFIRVYGDGRVRVHYPDYHVKAGDYTLTLPPDELRNLLEIFAQEQLINADSLDLRSIAEPTATEPVQVPLTLPDDHGVVSNVTIRAESIAPAGRAAESLDAKELSIPNAAVEAAARSSDTALQDFAAGVEQLESLAQRPELLQEQ